MQFLHIRMTENDVRLEKGRNRRKEGRKTGSKKGRRKKEIDV